MLQLSVKYFQEGAADEVIDPVHDNLVLMGNTGSSDTPTVDGGSVTDTNTFKLAIDTQLSDKNTLKITTTSDISIESLVDQIIEHIADKIWKDKFEGKTMPYLESLNGLTGDIYILAGRGMALEQDGQAIGICNTMYNTYHDKAYTKALDQSAYARAVSYIMCYQLCIYHFMNVSMHRSLTLEGSYDDSVCQYGSYLRYLSLKARWNHYVYTSWYNCSVIGGVDSISIAVGLNNIGDKPEDGNITVDISFQGDDYSIWYGIFLEEASILNTNLNANKPGDSTKMAPVTPTYKILRPGTCKQLKDEYYEKQRTEYEYLDIKKDQDEIEKKREGDDFEYRGGQDDLDGWKSEYYTVDERLACRAFYPNPKEKKVEPVKIRSGVAGNTMTGSNRPEPTNPTDPNNLDEPANVSDDPHNNPIAEFIEVPTEENITNPNNCQWSIHGGKWTNGNIIIQDITLEPGQSFKHVYSIAKHPSICGHTQRGSLATATIKITFTMGNWSITKECEAQCYLQEPSTEEKTTSDRSYQKRYILTATEDMGKYIKPTDCTYPAAED
jgi:hypothetical protein